MNTEVVYQSVDSETIRPVEGMSIEESRRHAQIQIALVKSAIIWDTEHGLQLMTED